MAFLEKFELKTVAQMPTIDKIIANDDDIVERIIDKSISLMKGYMSRFYDIDNIFNKEADQRHQATLKRLKDIVIYEIYERCTREQNAVALRRYNEAMKWLEELNTGQMGDKTLPARPKDDSNVQGTGGDTRFGGNVKYGSIY